MIFDVKMGENFRRKSQFFADGHKIKSPAATIYSSVVSRDSVLTAPTIAALNYLEVLSRNIQNVYVTVDCIDQVWVVAGTMFGSEAGKNMLMRKSLYVLKKSGVVFMEFLVETLDVMGYWPI